MTVIINSDGTSLRLTEEETKLYHVEKHQLYLRFKKLEMQRRGIYATNQGKYVQSVAELNPWDRQPTQEELE